MPPLHRPWPARLRDALLRHALAAGLAGAALALTEALREPLRGAYFFTAFPVVVAAGWLAGTAPALLAVALYALGSAVLFMPPVGGAPGAGTANLLRLAGFGVAGVLVAIVTGRLRTTTLRERALRESAEREARARAEAQRAAEASEARARSAGGELARAAARSEAYQRLAAALSAARTTDDVAEVAAAQALALAGAEGGALWVRSGPDALTRLGTPGSPARLALEEPHPAADAVRTAQPVWLASREAQDASYPAPPGGAGTTATTGASAALPLVVERRVVGVLELSFALPRAFDAVERHELGYLAALCGQALERARRYEAERAARRRAEAAEEEARRAVELQEQLLAVVGHDLRTPLSAIHMAAAALRQRGGLDERQAAAVDRITRSSSRMAGLIRDLLDLVRVRQGLGLQVARSPTDAAEVCRQTVAELQEAHPEAVVAASVAVELPVEGDGARLAQAVANLVGNAIQHGAQGEPVEVTGGVTEGRAWIAVHNAGPAIPGEVMPVMFEPFRRGAGAGGPGLGLGLFIAREIARAHGGTLSVRSVEGEGTTFTLSLPALAARPAAAGDVTSSRPTRP